ncbi:hypothetical protein ABH935_001318 [Catenulispora sp. GAS73]|uniref:hypothetical protein n=1 Tax=Catenulispora sp. GAS73 TaxID=3156269 RepID=UPI003515C3A6
MFGARRRADQTVKRVGLAAMVVLRGCDAAGVGGVGGGEQVGLRRLALQLLGELGDSADVACWLIAVAANVPTAGGTVPSSQRIDHAAEPDAERRMGCSKTHCEQPVSDV